MPRTLVPEQLSVVDPQGGIDNTATKVEIEQGVSLFSRWVELEGVAQAGLKVTFAKKAITHDWEMLFSLYDVPHNSSLDDWVTKYKNHPDKTLLDRMFQYIGERTFEPSCVAKIHTDGTSKKKVKVGFRVLRIKMQGDKKDAILFNSANIIARDDRNNPYSDVKSSCS